jgi:tRNA pseudouridine38-40 synthase
MAAALVLTLSVVGSRQQWGRLARAPLSRGLPVAITTRRARAAPCATAAPGDADDDAAAADAPPPAADVVRYRALVAYDGTHFAGFQLQPSADTVQGRLEAACAVRFQAAIRVAGASRTDAGVHARGQLVHFDVPALTRPGGGVAKSPLLVPAEQHEWALNALLPPAVRLRDLEPAPVSPCGAYRWSAIHNARGKHYAYRWRIGRVADPLSARFRAHLPAPPTAPPFDLAAARRGARALTGRHDFASFTNLAVSGASPASRALAAEMAARDHTRSIHSLELVDEGDGNLRLDVHLDGALYKMVRNVAGALSAIGAGRLDADALPALLAARDRSRLPAPAPACGLTRERVWFSDEPCPKPEAAGGGGDGDDGAGDS